MVKVPSLQLSFFLHNTGKCPCPHTCAVRLKSDQAAWKLKTTEQLWAAALLLSEGRPFSTKTIFISEEHETPGRGLCSEVITQQAGPPIHLFYQLCSTCFRNHTLQPSRPSVICLKPVFPILLCYGMVRSDKRPVKMNNTKKHRETFYWYHLDTNKLDHNKLCGSSKHSIVSLCLCCSFWQAFYHSSPFHSRIILSR